jgi:hypothetical protein
MPRTPTGRTSTTSRRRITAGATSVPPIRTTRRRPSARTGPYARDTRWATPTTPRNDVFIVNIADRHPATSLEDDPFLLSA